MNTELYQRLLADGKQYLRTRYDLLRLELLEKMSRIIALLLMVLTCMILLLAALFYFSFAVVELLSNLVGRIPAVCIIGGFFLVLVLAGYALRNRLFLNPMIRLLSDILFREPKDKDIDDHEQNDEKQ